MRQARRPAPGNTTMLISISAVKVTRTACRLILSVVIFAVITASASGGRARAGQARGCCQMALPPDPCCWCLGTGRDRRTLLGADRAETFGRV